MNTPADKPDLPAPDYQRVQTDGWEYGTVMHTDYYTADTVRRLLADERRKALEDAAAACARQERLRTRKDAQAVCRLCERDIRALIDKE